MNLINKFGDNSLYGQYDHVNKFKIKIKNIIYNIYYIIYYL